MEVLFGIVLLGLIVVVLVLVARSHARQEREALSVLSGMVRERQVEQKEQHSS